MVPEPLPRFAAALSVQQDAGEAEREALCALEAELEGETPDLVFAFATHHYGDALELLGERIGRAIGAAVVRGCTAESVIGAEREVEGRPGLALWAACLPGAEVRPFEVRARAGEDGEPTFDRLPPVGDRDEAAVLLVGDPFTFPVDAYLHQLNEAQPGVPVVGGMASGAMGPGQTLLLTERGLQEAGAVGVVIEGGVELVPVVSQGCRPVGRPWVITDCERNMIKKLAGRPALEVLMETWNALPERDRELLQGAPFIGLAIDPRRERFRRSDFLVRSIMGLHQRDRSIAVTDFVRRGQTVQLLVRDAASASEDLRQLLAACRCEGAAREPVPCGCEGALLFSCNGRGKRMFGEPHHDIGCVRSGLQGGAAVAGFFAAGEIGPVGGRNFLHGFTASLAVLRRRLPS